VSRMDGSSLRIPDGIEPISAYRVWFYTMARPRLHPLGAVGHLTGSSPWDGAGSAWVVATCRRPTNHREVPDEACTCGFYSAKTIPSLWRCVPVVDLRLDTPGCGWIVGRIQLAGKIIEHDDGYRSERARIAELHPCRDRYRSGRRLAMLLGVPLGEPLPAASWGFPPRDPSSIRLRVREWVQRIAA
jgi:hypothetical protein